MVGSKYNFMPPVMVVVCADGRSFNRLCRALHSPLRITADAQHDASSIIACAPAAAWPGRTSGAVP